MIWTPREIELVRWRPPKESDLPQQIHRLEADKVEVANAAEMIAWDEGDPFQLMICESCGFEFCAPGGWACLRRSAEIVLVTPDFEYLQERAEVRDPREAPPKWMLAKGVMLLGLERFTELRDRLKVVRAKTTVPEFEKIRELTGHEAAQLVWFGAPEDLLSNQRGLEKPGVESFAGVSVGSLKAAVARLADLIGRLDGTTTGVRLRRRTDREIPITIFVEAEGYPEWTPMVTDGKEFFLSPGGGWVID